MSRRGFFHLAVIAALGFVLSGRAAADASISAAETSRRWKGRLDGYHFTARVRLGMDRNGRKEIRSLTVWRDDQNRERERLMARFISPPDMRGLGLLYIENPDRSNDYFLYQPELQRVRRVPEAFARQDIYGVDLEYLGFGIAQSEPTEIDSIEPDALEGRPVLRIIERAIQQNQRFDSRETWLDPKTFIALRTTHRRHGAVSLIATTQEVRTIQGVPTPVRIFFERPLDAETVLMTIEEIDYESAIPDAFFSTLKLIKR